MGLYCTDIKLQGGEVKYSVEVLKTLSDEDLVSCLVFLGKDDIDVQQGKYIWDRLIQVRKFYNFFIIPHFSLSSINQTKYVYSSATSYYLNIYLFVS